MKETLGRNSPAHSASCALATRSPLAIGFHYVFPDRPIATIDRQYQCYPILLEQRLRAMTPGRPIEVFSMAVPAYTSYQGLNWLRRDIGSLKPDIVTICFGWNDVSARPLTDRAGDAERLVPCDQPMAPGAQSGVDPFLALAPYQEHQKATCTRTMEYPPCSTGRIRGQQS